VRTVLVADVAESVRLMEESEQETVARWRAFLDRVENEVLPAHGGRLVKSLGDGLLLEFPRVLPAVNAAFALQALSWAENQGIAPERQMLLRMGLQVGELFADGRDLYGHGVNLAARLAGLARPGEIVVSAEVRDQLTPSLDADVEDLGDCYLKHVREPVRAYRVGAPGARPVIAPRSAVAPDLRPTIAVIPFELRGAEAEPYVLGEVLADEVISALSLTPLLYVISRLSTTAFRGRSATLEEVCAHLKATFLLSGTYRVDGSELTLVAELSDARSGRVVWSGRLRGRVDGILSGQDDLIERIVAEVSAAVVTLETGRAHALALPNLESYTLLLGAISLMHRGSLVQFERAQSMLETLIERAPRQAVPHAWLAKWHVLRAQKGWSEDLTEEGKLALACTRRALDADPRSSLALTVDGFVHTNLLKRLDIAEQRYEEALRVNPNDSLAWLLAGTRFAFKGEGKVAVEATDHAHRLSPLDPLHDWYESLRSCAALSAGQYERSMELARSSLRINRMNISALRTLVIAQWLHGEHDAARASAQELLRLEPNLTVRGFQKRSPTSEFPIGKIWSEALRQSGVPDGPG